MHKSIRLHSDAGPCHAHWLTVPVELPRLRVVTTASMHLLDTLTAKPSRMDFITLGQPIAAEIETKYTMKWGKLASPSPEAEELNFCLEIQENAESWLVGGPRRIYYRAKVRMIQVAPTNTQLTACYRKTKPSAFLCC